MRQLVGPGSLRILCAIIIVVLTQFAHAAPRVHNNASKFLEFWVKAKSLPPDRQVAQFKQDVVPTFPEFYQFKLEKWKADGKSPEQELLKTIREFSATEAKFRAKSEQISREIDKNLRRFMERFPDFNTDFDLYVVHSLGEMDAGTRRINGKRYFIFGIDGMVKYHNFVNEVPFFHHELFHQYHDQKLAGSEHGEKLYLALWGEGLATYVSHELNPKSSMSELMLDMPEGLKQRCESKLKFLANDFAKKLDSENSNDYKTYFLLSSTHKEIPIRAGYYLGYLVHQELAKKFTIDQRANMKDALEIKSHVTSALKAIASR